MTRQTNKNDAVALRREQVARLRLRGLSLREIAVALTKLDPPITGPTGEALSVAQMQRDMKVLRAQWEANAGEEINKRRARQLAELDEVRRKAWANNDMPTVLKAIKQESDLFGTTAPLRVEHTWQAVLEKHGFNPGDVFEQLVASAAARLAETDGGGGGGGGEAAQGSGGAVSSVSD